MLQNRNINAELYQVKIKRIKIVTEYVKLLIFSFLLLFGVSSTLFAQPDSKYAAYPPNVASLGKYLDHPVELSTGVPQINIPIYTLEEGDLNLPISLSFHAKGIQVNSLASWVGTGWDLNVGGMVSRTVEGIPDDYNKTNNLKQGWYYSNIQDFNLASELAYTDSQIATLSAGDKAKIEQYKLHLELGYLDSGPDLFNYVLPTGYSGKFYFSHDKEVNFLDNHDNVKVKPIFGSGSTASFFMGFTITDPAGNIFIFNDAEYASIDASSPANFPQNIPASSWQLSSVSNFDKTDAMYFEYNNESFTYKSRVSCREIDYTAITAEWSGGYTCGSMAPCPTGHLINSISGKRLKKITCKNNPVTIDFITSVRDDIDNTGASHKLDKIKISYTANECREFEFSYDYYDYYSGIENTRLKLLNFQEQTCDGSEVIPPYIFDYYLFQNSNIFPPRRSHSIDHWGYWNNRNGITPSNAQFILPSFNVYNENGDFEYTKQNPSINRESNQEAMKAGVLKSITYPTGGKTEYEFEGNRVSNYYFGLPGLGQGPSKIREWKFFDYESPKQLTSGFSQDEIDNATYICWGSLGKIIYYADPNYSTYLGEKNIQQTGYMRDLLLPYVTANQLVYFKLQFSGAFHFEEYLLQTNQPNQGMNELVGGLRVTKITNDDDTGNEIVKTFNYNTFSNEQTTSTGRLLENPLYGSIFSGGYFAFKPPPLVDQSGSGCDGGFGKWYANFFDSSYRPLQNVNGRQICYSEVKVYEGTVSNNTGYSIHQFRPAPPGQWPPTGPSWHKEDLNLNDIGLPTEVGVYTSANDLIKKTTNEYNLWGNLTDGNRYNPFKFHILPCAIHYQYFKGTCQIGSPYIRAIEFRYHNRYYKLKNQVVTTYDTNGQNPVVSTTEYFYEKPEHRQLTKESSTNSDGKIFETRYKYYDTYGNTTVKNWLQTNNIIEPWHTITYVYDNENDASATPIDGTRFYYNNFGTTGDDLVYYPKTFQRYERTWDANGTLQAGSWKNQHIINSYDTNEGKPTSITVDGWSDPTTYTWTSTGKLDMKTYKDFITNYDYYTYSDFLYSITEPDGQRTTFDYDDFTRLDKVNSRDFKVKKDYNYSYQPNFIEEISTYNDIGTANDITNTVKTTFDGLGRDIQIDRVGHKWNSTTDITVLKEYNNRGLLWKVYEPDDDTNITASDKYTEFTYFPDPLGRIQSMKDPMGFVTSSTYGANGMEIDGFTANTLMRETMADPDGVSTSSYTDLLGRVVATRTFKGNEESITYTNYDDKSRVSTIIPPGSTINDANLIYKYTYDGADNALSTKFPDKGLMEYRYDARDFQIAMRDANIKANGKGWLNSQYDNYGRLHKQGFGASVGTVSDMLIHNYYDNNDNINTVNTGTQIYFGKLHKSRVNILNGFNKSNNYLTTNYTLDTYGRISTENLSSNHIGEEESIFYGYDLADNMLSYKHSIGTGLPGSNNPETRESFVYDNRGRLQSIQFKLNGTSKIVAQIDSYSVKDELLSKNIGSKGGGNYLQTVDYAYNHNGWLTSINGGSVTGNKNNCSSINSIASGDLFALDIRYNNAALSGHVDRKNGNISEIYWQVKDRKKNAYRFKYDFINRLTEAKHYLPDNEVPGSWFNAGYYDTNYSYDERGNITTLTRKGLTGNGTSCSAKQIDNLSYMYEAGTNKLGKVFDSACSGMGQHINPITGANYNKRYITSDAKTNVNGGNTNNNAIQFKGGTYITLQEGFSYEIGAGNSKFDAIIDPCPTNNDMTNNGFKGSESSYSYDSNGNLIYDNQKQLSIAYNHLNLPYKAEKNASNKIEWMYTADGRKLQKKATTSGQVKTKNYLGNMEFIESGGTNTLVAAYHSEGRVLNNGDWEYNLEDHLGNVRIVFKEDNNNTKIVQENHYYPFGMQMNGNWQNNQTVKNNYLYNDKELNAEIELDWSDYGARWYDAAIGRWNSPDPLAVFASGWTPYRYGFNNPISYIDPNGLFETKGEAKAHKRKYKVKGKIKKNKEKNAAGDKTVSYSIDNKKASSSVSKDRDLGVVTSALIISNSTNTVSDAVSTATGTISAISTAYSEHNVLNGKYRGASGNYYSYKGRKGWNQHTGTKAHMNKTLLRGKATNALTKKIGVLNYGIAIQQFKNGEHSKLSFGIELTSNTVSTFAPGIMSIPWTIGYEGLGRNGVARIPAYQNKFKPWARKKLGYD